MSNTALTLSLLALASPLAADGGRPAASSHRSIRGLQITQATVRQRVIIRIPRMNRAPAAVAPTAWKEKKGPKCIAAAEMGGALVDDERNVDLVLTGNRRVRARLERGCNSMDFYSGFYLRPGGDGMICADRDTIRMRSGASCEISAFKRLEPKR